MKTYKLELTEDEMLVIGAAGALITIVINDHDHKMFDAIEDKNNQLVFAQAMVETIPRCTSWLSIVEKMKKSLEEDYPGL